MNATPKPIRCWAVYDPKHPGYTGILLTRRYAKAISDKPERIIPGRFVPDKPKKRKGK